MVGTLTKISPIFCAPPQIFNLTASCSQTATFSHTKNMLTLLSFGKITSRLGDPSAQGQLPAGAWRGGEDGQKTLLKTWTGTHALSSHKSRLRFPARAPINQLLI